MDIVILLLLHYAFRIIVQSFPQIHYTVFTDSFHITSYLFLSSPQMLKLSPNRVTWLFSAAVRTLLLVFLGSSNPCHPSPALVQLHTPVGTEGKENGDI